MRTANQPDQINSKFIFPLFFALIFFVYSSTVFMPYLLLDENWLLRGMDMDPDYVYPKLRFLVGLVQGRPVFMCMLFVTRALVYLTSQVTCIQILRVFAIMGVSLFALQLYHLSDKIKLSPYISIPIVVSAITLPSFQVLVANATWLVVGLLFVTWSFQICFDAVEKQRSLFDRQLLMAIVLCGLCLATYQSLILVNFSLLTFVYLFGANLFSSRFITRLTLRVMLATFFSILIYYFLWKLSCNVLFGNLPEHRYGPQNILLSNVWDHFNFFITFRLQQALNLWNFTGFYPVIAGVMLAGLISKIILLQREDGNTLKVAFSAVMLTISYCMGMILISDLVALSSPNKIYSFTTLLALSLTCYFVFIWNVLAITSLLASIINVKFLTSVTMLMAICFMSLIAAQYTVLTRFSLPNWLLTSLVKETVSDVTNNGEKIKKINVYEAYRPLKSLYPENEKQYKYLSEFNWFNFENEFYVYWHLKNIFDQLKLADFPGVTMITADENIVMKSKNAPEKGDVIAFDFRKNSPAKIVVSR